jgi:hypothetical protein
LDGKCAHAIERGDLPLEAMTDQQLMAIGCGGSREPLIARMCRNETVVQGLRIDLGTDVRNRKLSNNYSLIV